MPKETQGRFASLVPILTRVIVGLALLYIPVRILSLGFLPPDDALSHCAKVASGKEWHEILVLRDDIKLDTHPGWHAILGAVDKLTRGGPEPLVFFSVVFLFFVFSMVPVTLMKRPEAWLLAFLVVLTAGPSWIQRLMHGRPFIISMAALMAICLSWPRLEQRRIPRTTLALLTFSVAAATWIQCSWYLFLVPLACFFLARRWRAGLALAGCMTVGVAVGSLLTGHPLTFLRETVLQDFRAVGTPADQIQIAGELTSQFPDFRITAVVAGILAWSALRRRTAAKDILRDPVLILAALCWLLGQIWGRFWFDWGVPAALIWLATTFEGEFRSLIGARSGKRCLLACVLGASICVTATTDVRSRWTASLRREYLVADDPALEGCLPEPGGIIYSDSMALFYRMFFKNFHAPWRYVVGIEPTMMRPDDFKTYQNLLRHQGREPKAFEPWVRKMRPEDRLILFVSSGRPPAIAGIVEWCYLKDGLWAGRTPREGR